MNKLLTSTGLIVGVVLLLAINIVSNASLKTARLDLTENRIYTLSQGSKNILQNLPEPVTLRLYLSEQLVRDFPAISTYALRVKELLHEYQRLAGDKLELQIIDPEPFSEAEDRAVGYGLQGVPIDASNTMFYFGLAGTNRIGEKEIITFFQPDKEESLEYDVTQLIYRLAHPKQKKIGIISTLPVQGETAMPALGRANTSAWVFMEQLKPLFDVQNLDKAVKEIPNDLAVLMLIHPKELTDQTWYAIDQFVLKGGRVLAFIDPFSEADRPDSSNPAAAAAHVRHSDLGPLAATWGVELVADKVVGDLKGAKQVQIERQGRAVVSPYPVWIDIDTSGFNTQDVITNGLDTVTFASVGSLSPKADAGTEFVPLIQSSTEAMLLEANQLLGLTDPQTLLKDFKGENQFTLAARISGQFKTAFPNGAPVSEEENAETPRDPSPEHVNQASEPVTVIVFADTDLLADQFWVRIQSFLGQRIAMPIAANGTLVTNAVDNLTGSNDLISVRNRGTFARPFTRVEDIRREAEQRFREQEQRLQAQLEETESKINQLQQQRQDAANLNLTPEQEQALEQFRQEQVNIRQELRQVQHQLQKDIDQLESRLKFLNIGLMPLLVGFGGLALGLYRGRRRRTFKQNVAQ
ncbi:GldG family protein [Thioflexithrix psekupsensis]|uniref:Uncharacterized protein n=1 Tax=Thioflexithrix psekupsensis TaxID=1570016 RepID=A0A251X6D5_9GAMM|nr:Gldg family protein [Thioflexithrix psekupsensis]OUD13305.1 hypothetical protein TPSD3_11810 [Thioflexithrix psekupsensis]